eukprot:COSAG01_NODE_12422_length_1742_cov_2.536214_2_plen_329_part_00
MGECREQPAPLEIMSRAVRIAARRLSACLTALPKSLPNPSAVYGSGCATALWPRRSPLLMARGCSNMLGRLPSTQLLPSSRYCSPRIQFCTTEAANFGLPAGVMLAVVMAPTLAAGSKDVVAHRPHAYPENARAVQHLLRTAEDPAHPTRAEVRQSLTACHGDQSQVANVARQCRHKVKNGQQPRRPEQSANKPAAAIVKKRGGRGSRSSSAQVAYRALCDRDAAQQQEKESKPAQAAFIKAVKIYRVCWENAQKACAGDCDKRSAEKVCRDVEKDAGLEEGTLRWKTVWRYAKDNKLGVAPAGNAKRVHINITLGLIVAYTQNNLET